MSLPATVEELISIADSLNESSAAEILDSPRRERLQLLAEKSGINEWDLLEKIAAANTLPLHSQIEAGSSHAENIPTRMLSEYACLPMSIDPQAESIDLVTTWPPEAIMDQWVYALTGLRPRWSLGPSKKVLDAINQTFGVGSGSLESSELDLQTSEQEDDEDEDAAIIRFVNEVILQALADRATDIHFEPQKKSLTLRYRVDGHLIPIQVPENLIQFQDAIIARIKVMARLNISERRRPQDGRISFRGAKEPVDVRISTLPTMYGESLSLRLLNQDSGTVNIGDLGISQDIRDVIEPVLLKPHGIILVTGPTGSGKSTTLNAFIRKIRAPERRIVTIEDPIEYEVSGINQTQINNDIGLTFAQALRHVLRQDPDVIMVGEIRDTETASIAVRASLTGHLVLSTLHTNDAAGALARLIDMEIEPFLIASSVELVMAQRLVRRLCPVCAIKEVPNPTMLKACLAALDMDASVQGRIDTIAEPAGCEHCQNTGYRGRIGLFEAMRIEDSLNNLIVQRRSSREIRETAIRSGMRTLQACGWHHVENHRTSLEEIMRFAQEIGSEQ